MNHSKVTMLAAGCVAGAMALSHPGAHAEEPSYATVSAGVVNLRDAEMEYPGNPARDRSASFDNGFALSGAFGRGMGETFRIEGEVAYRQNDESFILPGMGGRGEATSWSLMANGYWDAPVEWRIKPYLGLGVGAAYVAHEAFVVDDLFAGGPRTLADDGGWAFAYQAMAGFRAPVSTEWLVGAEYRYFSAAEPKVDDADGFVYDTDYDSHGLMLSATRRF